MTDRGAASGSDVRKVIKVLLTWLSRVITAVTYAQLLMQNKTVTAAGGTIHDYCKQVTFEEQCD